MATMGETVTGQPVGHGNIKALWSLGLGAFAMLNLAVLVVFMALSVDTLDDSGAWWTLLPFFGLTAGLVSTYLGATGWIDVRRGVTDRHLFPAQLGAVLGGIAAGMVLAAMIFGLAIVVFLAFSLAHEGGMAD
jgi:hypothetical protein